MTGVCRINVIRSGALAAVQVAENISFFTPVDWMASRPVSPAELFELRPQAWQKLLHVEAGTANRICGGRQRGSSCEPAPGWTSG
jgi:hypothetical protein